MARIPVKKKGDKPLDKYKHQRAYNKTHTQMVSMRLNIKTDADILAALEGKARQTELKRLLRLALEVENGTGEG